MKNICILIPAYNPNESLITLVKGLKEKLKECPIIVVNDGSKSDEIFEKLNKICPPDKIIIHTTNLGKGEALKNGLKYITNNYKSCNGIVTADCDLQHSINDIEKIANALLNSPDTIYLGSRNFNKMNIPFRSYIGNKIISIIFQIIYNIKINDTQTGLRGIPINFTQLFIDIKNSDFSFETIMLIKAKRNNIQIKEIPINTIYIENNKHSHFKPFTDSYKICKSLLKDNI